MPLTSGETSRLLGLLEEHSKKVTEWNVWKLMDDKDGLGESMREIQAVHTEFVAFCEQLKTSGTNDHETVQPEPDLGTELFDPEAT